MTTPNELRTLAQRLREHNDNPHHIDPMSERFSGLVNDAAEMLSKLAGSLAALDNCGQVMGRVHRGQEEVLFARLTVLVESCPTTLGYLRTQQQSQRHLWVKQTLNRVRPGLQLCYKNVLRLLSE